MGASSITTSTNFTGVAINGGRSNKMNSKQKIIFIAPATSQPRYHKRVMQISNFCDVEVFAFSRGLYEENTFPEGVTVILLGNIKTRKYLSRITRLIRAFIKVKRHIKENKKSLFYAFSFDCLLIAKLCGLIGGFYEVSDLRQTEGLGRLLPFFEKYLLRNIHGLILTSRFFYDDFYKKKGFVPKEKVFIIDNRVHPSLTNCRPSIKKFSNKRIKIGLVGFLRYRKTTELLMKYVKKRPDAYAIECYGDGPLLPLIKSYSCENIRYNGSFKNPDDLHKIYSNIDLNYVVYDNSYINVRLLTPNKLFESAFFGVPIVCCEETYVGSQIIEWGIGRTIRIENFEVFEKDMYSIDKEWLKQCSDNCFKIDDSELIDHGEKKLEEMLKNFISN